MCIKKWPALLLAVILLVSLAACGPAQIAAPAQQPSQELTLLPPEEKQNTDLVLLPSDPAPPSEEQTPEAPPAEEPPAQEPALDEDGSYTSKEDVALYIHLYGRLPDNFITKKEAEALGWSGGSLEPYAPGKCIGGSYFGNYEGLLPKKKGRSYTECDIDTLGKKSRGSKRIVFSNDGLIYYTEDHYNTFELLYGEVD
ncbi:MAG: ribonuclease [Clostridia bacterium]|jgi:Guanyl-specific ribonuclease Sa|nr:ribonuclease [Clostridia bacterium]